MAASSVLVIDTDPQRREYVRKLLEFLDHDALEVSEPADWQASINDDRPLLAALLGRCGTEAEFGCTLDAIKGFDPDLPVFLFTDHVSPIPVPAMVATRVLGQIEFPIKYQQLSHLLHQAELARELRQPASRRRPLELFRSLVGNSRAIANVRQMIEQVANTDANVLILGESGTGKEVVARNLHYHSQRRNRPFVPINCGAIPAELLESELFGHEKGAFTGAISARQGRFELAEGGTLFLDEIGDMSLPMQVKLLRVLQERTFERVGSNKSLNADVRIIAATHRNLEDATREGRFREDLYYRLNVFPIDMPPLRERAEDIPLLIHELASRIEHEKRGSVQFTPPAVVALTQYAWPGNVRELANVVERMAILQPHGIVDLDDLPEKFRGRGGRRAVLPSNGESGDPVSPMDWLTPPRLPAEGLDLKEHLNNLEYALIRQAMEEADGVVAQAAKRLRLGRTTLVEKLRKYEGGAREVDDNILT